MLKIFFLPPIKNVMYGEQKNVIQLFFSKEYTKKLIRIDFKGQLKSSANFFQAKNANLSLFNIKNVCQIFSDSRESKSENSAS